MFYLRGDSSKRSSARSRKIAWNRNFASIFLSFFFCFWLKLLLQHPITLLTNCKSKLCIIWDLLMLLYHGCCIKPLITDLLHCGPPFPPSLCTLVCLFFPGSWWPSAAPRRGKCNCHGDTHNALHTADFQAKGPPRRPSLTVYLAGRLWWNQLC